MTQFVTIDRATLEQLLEDVLQINREIGKGGVACDISNRAYPPIKRSLDALRAALANAEPTCTWSKDPDFEMGDTYDSACGEKWSFIDGGPTENRVSFCQGCGKPVKIVQDTL